MAEVLSRLFFAGFVRLHVLYHAAKEPVFGVGMMRELQRHGYEIGPGTLYPILHQLEEAGYLTSHTEVVGGKQRKYYRATAFGTKALAAAKERLRGLAAEVLDDQTPAKKTGRSRPGRRS